MSTSLSNLIDNLSEGFNNNKCTGCKSYIDCMSIKADQLIVRCFEYKKLIKKIKKDLFERFANIYEFCKRDINKFIL